MTISSLDLTSTFIKKGYILPRSPTSPISLTSSGIVPPREEGKKKGGKEGRGPGRPVASPSLINLLPHRGPLFLPLAYPVRRRKGKRERTKRLAGAPSAGPVLSVAGKKKGKKKGAARPAGLPGLRVSSHLSSDFAVFPHTRDQREGDGKKEKKKEGRRRVQRL